jgi:enoyl-CoA hydratase/carnithine racemase
MAMTASVSTTAASPPLLRDNEDGVATLTLARPDEFNAMSEDVIDALQAELDTIAGDDNIRVVVLAALGRAFSAGHNLKEMRARPDQQYYEELFAKCSRMMVSLQRLPQPVIARVQGIATAAGCQLVATCDLAVASSTARFATSGIGVGLFCMTPGVALARNVTRKHALEMLLTGEFIDAATALEFGLVNTVVQPDELDNAVTALAARVIAMSRPAIAAGKRVFYEQLQLGIDDAYELAGREMAANMMFHDAGEGIDAFIEKRNPKWRHE